MCIRDRTCVADVSCESESLCSRTLFRADGSVPFRALFDDDRHVGKCFNVVEKRRLAVKSVLYRSRRLYTRHTSVSLYGSRKSASFSAYECTCTLYDMKVEIESRTQDCLLYTSGSLEVGKKADILVIDKNRSNLTPMRDVVETLVYNMTGNEIEKVIINGETVVKDGTTVNVDEGEVVKMTQKYSEEIWRQGGIWPL